MWRGIAEANMDLERMKGTTGESCFWPCLPRSESPNPTGLDGGSRYRFMQESHLEHEHVELGWRAHIAWGLVV